MECWICGGKGTTGEHLIKASDLKSHFTEISEKKPVYLHTHDKSHLKVKSVKSDKLKSDALICPNCNNNLSQPYDKAWEALSSYTRSNWNILKSRRTIELKDVFGRGIVKSMLNVQLFFVKILGCRIIEHDIPIDITSFSQAFLNGSIHKNIYLSFEIRLGEKNMKIAGMTPISSINLDGVPILANWYYIIDQLAVNVVYDTRKYNKQYLRSCWTPKNHGNKITIYDHKI